MANFRPMMILPPLVFIGFVALVGVGMMREDPDALPSTRVGGKAPEITKTALLGFDGVTPDMLRDGEVKLVNFWASWCPPCRAEHPKLLKMAAEGIPIIGVNFRDQEASAAGYLTEAGNPFVAVAFDPQGRSAIDWGVTAPPETFIVDGDGTVLFRFAGPLVGSDYEQRFLPEFNKAITTQ